MKKVFAIFGALALASCAATPVQTAADPVFPTASPAGVCDAWGPVKGRASESAWNIIRVAPGGAEQSGKLKIAIAENGVVTGEWVIGEAKGGVWGRGARIDGPTLRGRWGAADDETSSNFLLRRWSTVSVGADDKTYCSFDGQYVIKGDPTRYSLRGYRLAE